MGHDVYETNIKRQKTKSTHSSIKNVGNLLCARPWGWSGNGTQSLSLRDLLQVNARGSDILLNA